MAGGVTDGQAVSAGVTNPSFLFKNFPDTATVIYTLASTDPLSGAQVDNVQGSINATRIYAGMPANTAPNASGVTPAWSANYVGASGNSLFQKIDALIHLFSGASGHGHTGADGGGGYIEASVIADVPLMGYAVQAVDLTTVSGLSQNVTSYFSGKIPSRFYTVPGVVANIPYNRVIMRNADNDDSFLDAAGNVVYGRITESVGTWTLTFYSEIAGVETAYNFLAPVDIRYYYQALASPMDGTAPVYSPMFFIPSDNSTADVLPATTGVSGKVLLASGVASDVAATATSGTAGGTVANANHVHKGVHSFAASGQTALYGDVVMVFGAGLSVSTSGQNISASVPVMTGAASGTPGVSGLVPTPASGSQASFLRGDGIWAVPASGGSGSVTSVGLVLPSFMTVSGSPITTSGTVSGILANQASGTVFAGPSGGAAAAPAFRGLVAADYQVFGAATSGVAGTQGAVPAPASGSQASFLRGDATWAVPSGSAAVAPTVTNLTTTGTTTGYLFTVTSANATVGATYTNNGHTFTVLATIASGTQLYCSGALAPLSSGTLTKSGGTGDATIAFSAALALATYTAPSSPAPLYLEIDIVGGGAGAFGSGSSSGSTPGAGTQTIFGTGLIICPGGGIGSYGSTPGLGGAAPTIGAGPIVVHTMKGGDGQGSTYASSAGTEPCGGMGGSNPIGPAGGGGPYGASGNVGTGYGSGGGGAGATTAALYTGGGGGSGAFARVIIASPSATYYYAVGTAGAGGSAGGSGTAGGAGAPGKIKITEKYQ